MAEGYAARDPAGPRIVAGAMSGTSADGVDVALVRIAGRGLEMTAQLLHHHLQSYDAALKQRIFEIRQVGSAKLAALAQLGREITLAYASAVNGALAGAGLTAADLAGVAAHGQTLYHDPPNTMQWLDPALLAAETGCAVVSDFRRADCAAGGQGAPLVPFADYVLFRSATQNRVLLNIGGIANLTWLPAGCTPADVVAFDTGPGNCLSDWACRQFGRPGTSWDEDGAGALRGRVATEVVARFVAAAYFSKAPPKSTDGPGMIAIFERALAGKRYDLNDLLATAIAASTSTIAREILRLNGQTREPFDVIVGGGGVRNGAMMQWLHSDLGPHMRVQTTQDLGMPPDAKEAVAFALLGAATLDGVPSNIPRATGASRSVVLGSITPKP